MICENCQTPISEGRKYCGHSCAAIKNNGLYPKRKPEGFCFICKIPITTRRVYCSTVCKSKASWQRRVEQAKRNGGRVVSWRRNTKKKAVGLMGGCCQYCGYNRSMRALHFHHKDPLQKDFHISKGIKSWDSVVEELKKCILVCSNCHAEIHDGLLDCGVPELVAGA